MLCDAQIENDRRRIVLSSIVKIYNNTTMPLAILKVESVDTKKSTRVARIEVNKDYYVPLDLIYTYSSSPIFLGVDE
jgi:hypothetical protein